MENQVEEIKSKNDIVSIIGERVELKKAGSKFKAPCPFHSEKTPSFVISPELQIFKCFGCGKSGDVITFLEEYEGMDFYEALKYLAERSGITLKQINGQDKGFKERFYQINNLVSHFYHYVLTKHPVGKKAFQYITEDRGLKISTVEKFQIGFSPDEPFALRKFILDKNKVTLKELEEVGILYMKGSFPIDRFRGRIIFPLYDHRGNIVGFAGRILPTSSNKDLAKYINTPETQIYKKSKVLFGLNEVKGEIKKANEAIVVEGELDMISCWQAGIKNVVAIKGSALTEEQAILLSRYAKNLVIALDADLAGNEAARRAILVAEKEGMEIKVLKLNKYKDPDEAARKDRESLIDSIKNAVGVWDFIIDSVFNKYKGDTGDQKGRISKELVPILSSIEDKIVQAHYINLVANKLKVPQDAVSDQIRTFSRGYISQKSAVVDPTLKKQSNGRRGILEERLLAVILSLNPKYLNKKEFSKLFQTAFSKRIIEEYLNTLDKEKFTLSEFAGKLPQELRNGFTDLILKDVDDFEEASEEHLEKELQLIKKEIEIFDIKEKLEQLGSTIQDLDDDKDRETMKKSEMEFASLTKKLQSLGQDS